MEKKDKGREGEKKNRRKGIRKRGREEERKNEIKRTRHKFLAQLRASIF